MVRLLVKHKVQGKTLPYIRPIAIADAKTSHDLSPIQKDYVIKAINKATAKDITSEGISFLQSCMGAVCFSQGDLIPDETNELMYYLSEIFTDSIANSNPMQSFTSIDSIEDLIDTPKWKPRNASPCYIAGVSLISYIRC